MEIMTKDEWVLENKPNWEAYNCRPSMRITELSCLAFDVSPRKADLLITEDSRKDRFNRIDHHEIQRDKFNNTSNPLKKFFRLKQDPSYDRLKHESEFINNYDWLNYLANEHRSEFGGVLNFIEGTDRLNVFDFADWVIEIIPSDLPPDFPRRDALPADSELSEGERNSLSQRNNKLVRMVGELIDIHFGKDATAGRVCKEINSTDKTVRNILKQYRER